MFESLEQRQLLAADVPLGPSVGFTGGPSGAISGAVFASSTVDCEAHGGEVTSMASVRVQLLDATGTVVREASTDGAGAYYFADLIPGEYAVRRLMDQPSIDVASHVGDGGGIVLDANLVGEITVHGGETLTGYNFYTMPTSTDAVGPGDRRIVPHERPTDSSVAIVSLSMQTSSASVPLVVIQQRAEPVFAPNLVSVAAVTAPQTSESFGGSSRELQAPDSIKAWDEYPLDGLFSTINFLSSADSAEDYTTVDELMQYEESAAGGADAAFVDGYTTNTIDWWYEDTDAADELTVGEVPVINLDGFAPPQIASRRGAQLAQ